MLRRALRIWLCHALAFLAGLVVSGVVSVGLWFVVPTEAGSARFIGTSLALAILSVGMGYAIYLTLIVALLGIAADWGYYLVGPLIVVAVMALVFVAVYHRVLGVSGGSLLGYGLLFAIGGGALHRLVGDERTHGGDLPDPAVEDAS